MPLGEHRKGLLVVEGNVLDIDINVVVIFYSSNCIGQNRQVFNTQKVELKQADPIFAHTMHFVLGDELTRLGVDLNRHVIIEWFGCNYDAGGVDAYVPGASFDFLREIDNLPTLGVFFV